MGSRKTVAVAALLAILAVALVAPAAMLSADTPVGIEIDVAPATLNLSYNGQWVTVHTDLAYNGATSALAWYLNGVPAGLVCDDDCGNLVAKFDVGKIGDAVKVGDEVEMTLTGSDGGEVLYSGSDVIRVIDVGKR